MPALPDGLRRLVRPQDADGTGRDGQRDATGDAPMKDLHLIRFALANEWALLPAKIVDLMGMLAYHASGQKHTPEELHALVGGDRAPSEPSQRGAVAVLPLRGVISHRAGGIEE